MYIRFSWNSSTTICRHTLDTALIPINDEGFQKFIGLVLLVLRFDGLDGIINCLTLTTYKAVYSDLDSLPSLVTIHGVISSYNSGKLTILFLLQEFKEVLGIFRRRTRCGITTITKEVNIDMRNALLLGSLQEGVKVSYMRVNTPIRYLVDHLDPIV